MSIEQDFEIFWQAFPKRTGRIVAFRQYVAAIYYANANPESILRGVEAYKKHLAKEGTEFQFIASPAKWLSDGRWDDEYEPNLPKITEPENTVRIGETYSQMQRRLERSKLSVVK